MLTFSHNKLNKYWSCPYRFKHEKPTQIEIIGVIGCCVHETTARAITSSNHMPGQKIILDEQLLDSIIYEEMARCKLNSELFPEAKELTNNALNVFNTMFFDSFILSVESDDSTHMKHDKNMFLQSLGVKLKDKEGVEHEIFLEGSKDLCLFTTDGRITIVDWKSGYNPESELQADLYAVQTNLQYGADEIKVLFPFIRLGQIHSHFYDSKDRIEQSKNIIINMIQQLMLDEKFEKRYNKECHSCNMVMDCEVFKNNTELDIDAESKPLTERIEKYQSFLNAEKAYSKMKKVYYENLKESMPESDIDSHNNKNVPEIIKFQKTTYKEDNNTLVDIVLNNIIDPCRCLSFSYKKTQEHLSSLLSEGKIDKSLYDDIKEKIERNRYPIKSTSLKVKTSGEKAKKK